MEKTIRKHFYWNNSKNSLSFEVSYLPMCQLGIDFGEDITFSIGFIIQIYISLGIPRLNSWLHRHKIENRELKVNMWFKEGWSVSLNLMSDTMGWKKGDWKWYWTISDTLKGKYKVSKEVIEERDILVPMPEKSYEAHAILADWTWHYPRWFPKTVRRCEIKVPEGLPHAGKGENSWDCGDDATFGITTGRVRNIAEAVGNLVGSVLRDRVRYGGWKDWNWRKIGANQKI